MCRGANVELSRIDTWPPTLTTDPDDGRPAETNELDEQTDQLNATSEFRVALLTNG